MNIPATCPSWAPALLCQHSDVLVYLMPAAALAVVIRLLVAVHPVFFLLTVSGTICHELAHFIVGWATGAAPAHLTVIPRRQGRHWQLGAVTLTRVRWFNAAPAALAPLLIVLIPVAVAHWRTGPGWRFEPLDLLLALLLAPQFLRFWPSRTDWKIAARSWPYLLIAIAAAGIFAAFGQDLPVWSRFLSQF